VSAYYNEIDPFAAQWLRNLIAKDLIATGDVDERSIIEVQPDDLKGYDQCHFFAGIGGWSYALRRAGWADDRPVWTGSCPCQSFSSAATARQDRRGDARHLWPAWRPLIAECLPRTVFGEQTAQAGDWFDEVCDDVESLGYSIGASVLPACSIGQDHARFRLYFAGHANRHGKPRKSGDAEMARLPRLGSERPIVAGEDGVSNRMATMRAYGNSVVPQVAAEVIKAYMECRP